MDRRVQRVLGNAEDLAEYRNGGAFVWSRPATGRLFSMFFVAAGGGGAAGGSSATQAPGGAGASSGSSAQLIVAWRRLPAKLYITIGLGGDAAVAGGATTITDEWGNVLLTIPGGGAGGSNAGGAPSATAWTLQCEVAKLTNGANFGAAGSNAGGNGANGTGPSATSLTGAGAGGGGQNSTGVTQGSGGSPVATFALPAQNSVGGAATVGGDGTSGIGVLHPWCVAGGAGGGAKFGAVGGKGGAGGPGCGGGGGGAGLTGGAGGRGGDGYGLIDLAA